MLNETELKALLKTAEDATPPFWNAQSEELLTRLFKAKFDPTTCAELVREVLRLRSLIKIHDEQENQDPYFRM